MTFSAFSSLPGGEDALLAGRFRIEREVGRGGVGIVYRAKDERSGEAVALKIIAIAGVDALDQI